MGYVHKPIPPDILAAMPPALRREAIRQEREHLAYVQRRQRGTGLVGWLILIGIAAYAVHILASVRF